MTAADQEVELKFVCAPDALGAVLAAAPAGDEREAELISVYFDTPDQALRKAGVSLRVRESEGRRVQTLKRGEGMAREEFETPIEGLAPDRALGPLSRLVPDGAPLTPAFNVRVIRRQRTFRYAGARIELALDQGEVVGGDARTPICEVELELKAGPPKALFDLARELLDAAPLYLSFDTKAARGQALLAGDAGKPRMSDKVRLEGDETVAEAFQATARKALAQIAANAQVQRAAPSPEAVHQLRVGARRFRSALSAFGKAAEDQGLPGVKAEMAWLSHACDEARNLDVFAESLIGDKVALAVPTPGLAVLRKRVAAARAKAYEGVGAVVASARFRRLMVDAAAWLETGSWREGEAAGGPVKPFARAALKERRRMVLERGEGMAHADDAALHRLRITAKKLRYAGEAFAGLYSKTRAAAFTDCVKDLQAELGLLSDLAMARPLIERLSLPADAAFAAGQLLGERAAGKPNRIRRAAKAFERLAKARPYWAR